ncbi:polysaccharide deacetylase [Sandaracinus amylolyticus]|uniref:Polysaccharide deacetylase n=1 Tax=Sandaracinus amylolyticus TaxID=927083 RepID=A0A0F6SF67_9BACT|nr:polysaccharide deacetylase [Sandaracinus amylolyticus]
MGRGLPIVGRVLLCASALAGGALLAHFTRPVAHPAVHAMVREDVTPPEPVDEPIDVAEIAPAPDEHDEPVQPLDGMGADLREGMVITGGTPHRMILFSFDDGPDHRYTPGLLDTLDALGIRAMFFLTARRFEGTTPRERLLADIARDIVARGHIVGSHTMDHVQLPLLSHEDLQEQVLGTERVFENVLGARPWLIRPPGGSRSPRIDAWLAERGYTQVLWNLGTGDFQVRTSDDVVRTFTRVLERRERENGERGGIVLLHDIHEWSVEALPRIVHELEDRNCALLEAGEELYDVVDDPRPFFTTRGEASASEEAPPAMPEPAWLEARQARLRADAEARCARLAMR